MSLSNVLAGKIMERSLFYIFISLAMSLLIGFYQLWWLFFIVLAGLLLAFTFTSYSRLALFTIAILITGVLLSNLSWLEIPASLPADENFTIEGKVIDYPEYAEGRGRFVLKTEHSNRYLRKIQVFLDFDSSLQRGDLIALKGSLKPPNPPGNPGQFNYPAYLQHEDIFYTLTAKDIKVLKSARGINQVINSFRKKGIQVINNALPSQEAAILLGMLLGKKDAIDDIQYSDFQKTGIVHIFAVSGLHVGFLLLFCGVVTSLLNMSRRNKLLFCLLIIGLYGTLVGWPLSVIRASIMATVGLIAYYVGRENQMLNSLGLAGIIILLVDPQALFKISFQLSFLATFGLVFIFPILRQPFENKRILWDLILIPISAQLAVLPLVAYHFNLFTPAALISNIFITYTAGASVILGFMALILAPVLPALSAPVLYPAGFFIEIIIKLTAIIQNIPFSYLWVATPKIPEIIIYYCGLILMLNSIKGLIKREYVFAGFIMVLAFITVLCLPASLYHRGTMEIVFIDVGQGDSTLIKTPQGKFILIDGGGSQFYDVASTRLMPYLHHRGIREIYIVINTHPDTDHLAGLEKTAEELKVVHIGLPQTVSSVQDYNLLKELGARQNSNIVKLYQGQSINIENGFTIKVLHPKNGEAKGSDYNQESLVLVIGNQEWSILLTGDLHAEQLEKLVEEKLLTTVNIVKVPHHGSRFSLSENFYHQISPEWAVICVGNNNFGHPHNEVIKALEAQNIKLLRTDEQGNIYFDSNGSLKTFK